MKLISSFKALYKYFLILISIFAFQSIGMYWIKECKDFRKLNNPGCNLINKSKILYPGRFLLKYTTKNLSDLNRLIKNSSSSGLVVKNLSNVRTRFNNLKSGFTFYYPKGTRNNAGYILLSAGDSANDGKPLIELWDLNHQKILYKWNLNNNDIIKKGNFNSRPNSLKFIHPILLKDGNLILLVNDTLFKFDPKGQILKINNQYKFHHSLELDDQNKIYASVRSREDTKTQRSDGFAILDENLNVLKTYFLLDIFNKENLNYKLNRPHPTVDPFHINDVEPLKDENKTRIVLLSLRSQSNIIAYDLNKDSILWILEGYTSKQHDVDILNKEGTYISVFDNNIFIDENFIERSKNNIFTTFKNLPSLNNSFNSQMVIFSNPSNHKKEIDLEVEQFTFENLKKDLIPKTITEGRAEYIIDNDSIFIEESNYGRSFDYDVKNKKILWEYINRNDKGNIYYMKRWSRRIKTIDKKTLEILNKFFN